MRIVWLACLPFLLFVGSAIFAVRSYWVLLSYMNVDSQVVLNFKDGNIEYRKGYMFDRSIPRAKVNRRFSFPGVTFVDLEYNDPRQIRRKDGALYCVTQTIFIGNISVWWITILALPLPLAVTRIWWRSPRIGMCVCCGYDLTSNTSGICPECGTSVPVVVETVVKPV